MTRISAPRSLFTLEYLMPRCWPLLRSVRDSALQQPRHNEARQQLGHYAMRAVVRLPSWWWSEHCFLANTQVVHTRLLVSRQRPQSHELLMVRLLRASCPDKAEDVQEIGCSCRRSRPAISVGVKAIENEDLLKEASTAITSVHI